MNLYEVRGNIQKIAEAISAVLNVDVTICDNKLIRIAGTGLYKKNIGSKINNNSAFGYTMKMGNSYIIENPRENKACLYCEERDKCKESAEVASPIFYSNKVVGVIGLVAFQETQKIEILKNEKELLQFLNKMGELIVLKLIDHEKSEKIKLLAAELREVINLFDSGVALTDSQGNIKYINPKGNKIFKIDSKDINNISKYFRNINLNLFKEKNYSITNQSFIYRKENVRGIFKAKSIYSNDELMGILFIFEEMEEVIDNINYFISENLKTSFNDIVGESGVLEDVKEISRRASVSKSTILIQGESGTGKELFARAIYNEGNFKGPFITLNCAAIPEQLFESELFGYEEGAFTGAKKGGKPGKFEMANKGIIFLDEISEIPINLQSKLLRVLQEKTIERVGGKFPMDIDVKVVAATNCDLEEKVSEGSFRKDLYFRLAVIPINVPPLRDRGTDLNLLINHFINKFNLKLEKNINGIDDDVNLLFSEYPWPGNIRELENTIEYSINVTSNKVITMEDLPSRLKAFKCKKTCKINLKSMEEEEIKKIIGKYGKGSKSIEKAAKELGISRATLYRRIKKYSL
ncbi:MAG: sigma 54-interacting transcriptional regulator [Bacillota bacterium]|nr:sigma 54-interacting transcriptional regulator [Bacillota bacterium]